MFVRCQQKKLALSQKLRWLLSILGIYSLVQKSRATPLSLYVVSKETHKWSCTWPFSDDDFFFSYLKIYLEPEMQTVDHQSTIQLHILIFLNGKCKVWTGYTAAKMYFNFVNNTYFVTQCLDLVIQ